MFQIGCFVVVLERLLYWKRQVYFNIKGKDYRSSLSLLGRLKIARGMRRAADRRVHLALATGYGATANLVERRPGGTEGCAQVILKINNQMCRCFNLQSSCTNIFIPLPLYEISRIYISTYSLGGIHHALCRYGVMWGHAWDSNRRLSRSFRRRPWRLYSFLYMSMLWNIYDDTCICQIIRTK